MQKPQNPKPKTPLKGLRITIISLAFLMVGGGLMLFFYAFQKAHQAMQKSPAEAACVEELELELELGEIVSASADTETLTLIIREQSGQLVLHDIDRCTGGIIRSQTIVSQ